MVKIKIFTSGLLKKNPVFILAAGICPVLAVTTTAWNSLVMGGVTFFVLLLTCLFISVFKNLIPEKISLPAFLVTASAFTAVADLFLQFVSPEIHHSLGIFVPLSAVSALITGRAGSVAYQNSIVVSILDSLGMGLGFGIAILLMGCFREFLGSGSLFNLKVFSGESKMVLLFVFPPGAFITFGYFTVLFRRITHSSAGEKEK